MTSTPPEKLQPHWANLFSTRYWFGSFIGAVVFGGLASLLWEPLLYVVGIPVLLVLLFTNLVEQVYYCPFCKKHVKTGARACHHCGRTVKGDQAPAQPVTTTSTRIRW